MFQLTQTIQLMPHGEERVADAQPQAVTNVTNVTNAQVAEVLFNIATLLEMQQGNPYRIAAYRNAARGMLALAEPAAAILARGVRLETPGLGDRLRRKIGELVSSGRMTFYDDLCEESLPEDVRALMAVPRVGPRTALRLTEHLGIHSVVQLREAAEAEKLRIHFGFGPRSERRLAEGARAVLDGRLPADLHRPSPAAQPAA